MAPGPICSKLLAVCGGAEMPACCPLDAAPQSAFCLPPFWGFSMALRIARHDTVDIVELSDGTRWRIWPADVPATLRWLPDTELEIAGSEDEFCSHELINRED